MKAKENIIKALNPKWTMLFVLISFTSLMSSCVEGDLYDLYDEDLDISSFIHNKKQSKEAPLSSMSCGICCIAYIISQIIWIY